MATYLRTNYLTLCTRQNFAALAVAGSLLCGCAAPIDPNWSPAQQRLVQQSNRFNSTVAEGAIGGALVGAAAGLLIGGNLKSAAIGAGAGGVAGAVAGYLVAQNNFKRAQTSDNLAAAITDAKTSAASARDDAATSQQVAAEARAQARILNQQIKAHQITADQYRVRLASYNESLKALESVSKGLSEQSKALHDNVTLAGARGRELASSANDIDKSRREVDTAADQLRQVLSATPAA